MNLNYDFIYSPDSGIVVVLRAPNLAQKLILDVDFDLINAARQHQLAVTFENLMPSLHETQVMMTADLYRASQQCANNAIQRNIAFATAGQLQCIVLDHVQLELESLTLVMSMLRLGCGLGNQPTIP